ncbi:MAG TPA: hypothetical protein PKD68_04300 [Candidatus Saccharibacteria bacterium]|nr:hypothetical protein [Candidatus Saccharibacteria bacterium]
MSRENSNQDIIRRLDVIVALLANVIIKDDSSTLRDKILTLSGYGLTSTEIALVLGKSVGYVSKEISVAKKGNGRKNG